MSLFADTKSEETDLLQKAQMALIRGHNREAISIYESIISKPWFKESENKAVTLLLMADLYEKVGNPASAIDVYKKVIENREELSVSENYLWHAQSKRMELLIQVGNYMQARKELKILLEQYPTNREGELIHYAMQLLKINQLTLKTFREIYSNMNYESIPIRTKLEVARIYEQNNQQDSALEEYFKMLDTDPVSYPTLIIKILKLTKGTLRENDLEKYLKDKMNSDIYKLMLAYYYTRHNLIKESKIVLKELVDTKLSPYYYYQAGQLCLETGMYSEGERINRNLLESNPTIVSYMTALVESLLNQGKTKEAVDFLDNMPEPLKNRPEAYQDLVSLFHKYNQPEAENRARQILNNIEPQRDYLYSSINRIESYLRYGEFETAINNIEAQLKINPKLDTYFNSLVVSGIRDKVSSQIFVAAAQSYLEKASGVYKRWLVKTICDVLIPEQKDITKFLLSQKNEIDTWDEITLECAEILSNRGNWTEAQKLLSAIPEDSEYLPQTALMQTKLPAIIMDASETISRCRTAIEMLYKPAREAIPSSSEEITMGQIVWLQHQGNSNILEELILRAGEIALRNFQTGDALEILNMIGGTCKNHPELFSAEIYGGIMLALGKTYSQLRSWEKAENYFNEAIESNIESASWEAALSLGDLALWQKKYTHAEEIYQNLLFSCISSPLGTEIIQRLDAMQSFKGDLLDKYSVSTSYEAQGRWEDAEKAYRELTAQATHTPLSNLIMYRIGKMQSMQGKYNEAIATWEKVLEQDIDDTLRSHTEWAIAETKNQISYDKTIFENIFMSSPDSLPAEWARSIINSETDELLLTAPSLRILF